MLCWGWLLKPQFKHGKWQVKGFNNEGRLRARTPGWRQDPETQGYVPPGKQGKKTYKKTQITTISFENVTFWVSVLQMHTFPSQIHLYLHLFTSELTTRFHTLFDTISNILSLLVIFMFFVSDLCFLSHHLQFPSWVSSLGPYSIDYHMSSKHLSLQIFIWIYKIIVMPTTQFVKLTF